LQRALAATGAAMAGNNYMNYPDPRWRSNYFYEENYGPMQQPSFWNDGRLPDYQPVREEPARMFYEGDQWRPNYNHGRYNGVPQYNGPQYYYNAEPPRPMDEVFGPAGPRAETPFWMQQSSPLYDRKYDMNYRPRRITVELWMPICCNKCERRVKQHLEGIQGAEEVTTDQVSKKVTVTGDIDPDFVLSCAQSHKPDSTFWYMTH